MWASSISDVSGYSMPKAFWWWFLPTSNILSGIYSYGVPSIVPLILSVLDYKQEKMETLSVYYMFLLEISGWGSYELSAFIWTISNGKFYYLVLMLLAFLRVLVFSYKKMVFLKLGSISAEVLMAMLRTWVMAGGGN